MADRFYTNSALAPGPVVLQGPEAHHLAIVRRFRAGDVVTLFNGDGREYPAEVVGADKRAVSLNVLRVESPVRELPFRLEVAAAMPKGDRGDVLVEKLTELGATDFVPLSTERAVVRPRDTKLERLQGTVIQASKQCGRNLLMRVHPMAEWADYCRRPSPLPMRLLAHAGAEPGGITVTGSDVGAAVGPEGGFTEPEVQMGRQAGWRVVSLGPRTLRVETAALALAALLGLRL